MIIILAMIEKTKMNKWLKSLKDDLLVKAYQFDFVLLEKLTLDGFIGTAFRGLFGHSLKAICCPEYTKLLDEGITENWLHDHKKEDCLKCAEKPLCIYSFLFESTSPHPFIIEVKSNNDDKQTYQAGDTISFRVILIGYANYYFPFVLRAANIMGQIGFGNKNKKAELTKVSIPYPFNEVLYDKKIDNQLSNIADIYAESSIQINDFENVPNFNANNCKEIKIRLLSPLKVDPAKDTDREFYQMIIDNDVNAINTKFFYHFFIRLQKRIKDLANKYGKLLNVEFDPILYQEAKMINTFFDSSILKASPYSNRRKDHYVFSSFLGDIFFSGSSLDIFLPILSIGEIIHFGRLTSAGYGQYDLWLPNN